ncbi:LysR family transcriptional regulator [Enemella evansiae]|uniref:LysR family transcriptional regulator n=1 Tax=Enemella evansiae TaxID=2016499 RepID=UPI000B96B0EC|nr:LysR family transcriptional regulator [Enemella evansiae]OYO13072.1 LysR family transcriptional regulator [Enemella evansiae]
MIDVNRLRVFRAVVAAGSIQAAATNLGYTPSAVSQQVTTLQRETGLTLLERVGRGVEPTAAGLELAEAAEGVLGSLDEVESRVADLRVGRTGSLSVAYISSVGMAWMPGIIAEVVRDFPGLRLGLFVREVPEGSESDRMDIEVFVKNPEFPARLGFRDHDLMEEPYQVILPVGHPLAEQDQVELSALRGETWIASDSAESSCQLRVDQACAAAGFVAEYAVRADDHLPAIAFVRAGVGVTIVPRLCTLDLVPGVVARDLVNPTPTRQLTLRVRKAVEDAPQVHRVVAGLQDASRRDPLAPTASGISRRRSPRRAASRD